MLAGCGTTVSTGSAGASSVTAPGTGELGVGAPATSVAGGSGPVGAAGTSAGVSSGALPTTRGATGTVATPGSTTGPASTPGGSTVGDVDSSALAPGVTATTITLGAVYTPDQNSVAQSVGVNDTNTHDAKTMVNIVLDDLNAHGGVAGRKVQLVWHARPIQSAETYDQLDQEACADFTQDHKVFAAVGSSGGSTFDTCMMKAGAAVLAGGYSTSVDSTAQRAPYFLEGNALSWSRQMRTLITSVHQQGFFTPGYKLGVLSYDTPNGHEVVDKAITPTLQRFGLKASDTAYLPPNKSFADNGPAVSQLQNIVLKFQAEHITHVLMLAVDGGLPLIFSRIADGQHYRPKYAVTSQWGLSAVAGDYAAGQLDGAMGISWFPDQDFRPEDDPTVHNPLRQKCLKLYRSKGMTQDNAADLDAQLSICWLFWYFRDAVNAAGGVLTRDALLRGSIALGRHPGVNTDVLRITAAHHDGVAAVRPVKYVSSCTCFQPSGPLQSTVG